MVVEGVLRVPDSDAHYETGLGLYMALAPNSRLYLLSHAWTEPELDIWLTRRQLTGHMGILRAQGPTPADRLDALKRIRSWRVELCIEPDPACAAREIAEGWHVLLHTHALYTDPQWRPDHTGDIRPWDELTAEINHQQDLRLHDTRARAETP